MTKFFLNIRLSQSRKIDFASENESSATVALTSSFQGHFVTAAELWVCQVRNLMRHFAHNDVIIFRCPVCVQSYSMAVYLVKQQSSTVLLQRLRGKGIRNPDHSRALSKDCQPLSERSDPTNQHLNQSWAYKADDWFMCDYILLHRFCLMSAGFKKLMVKCVVFFFHLLLTLVKNPLSRWPNCFRF